VVVSVVVSADSHLFQILILFLKNFQRYIFSLATGSFEKTFVQEFSFSDLILPCSESVLEHIISWTISISGFWKLRKVSDFARLSRASTDT
jgi:hypothetical protein